MTNPSLAIIKKEMHFDGGIEKVTNRLLLAFLNKGVDVSFYTSADASLPCTTFSHRPKGLLKVSRMKDFDQWAQKESRKHSIVFSMDRCSYQTHHRAGNGVHAAYLDLRSQTEGKLKKLSFALNPLHRLQLKLERKTFESPETKVIIVNSEMVKNQIVAYYNTPASKITVVHNGVEWKELEADFNESFTLSHRDVFQFLFVGHNFKRKGLDILLSALSKLNTKKFHLSVVGHDKEMSAYKMLAHRLKLEKHVTFFGRVDAKPYYLAADALVIPSIYDPFANVTVEALALGLFVITSRTNGGHEVILPHTGAIVETPDELIAALETAMQHPKEKSRAEAIRNSIQHLDYSHQLEKICDLCLG